MGTASRMIGPVRPGSTRAFKKYGRTTGETKGFVAGVNFAINVIYEVDANNVPTKVALFVGQTRFAGDPGVVFSMGGDSGSLIVTKGGARPLALLFAGDGVFTYGNPIDAVLSAFGVAIDGD